MSIGPLEMTVRVSLGEMIDALQPSFGGKWLRVANLVLTKAKRHGCKVRVVSDPEYAIEVELSERFAAMLAQRGGFDGGSVVRACLLADAIGVPH